MDIVILLACDCWGARYAAARGANLMWRKAGGQNPGPWESALRSWD